MGAWASMQAGQAWDGRQARDRGDIPQLSRLGIEGNPCPTGIQLVMVDELKTKSVKLPKSVESWNEMAK